MGTMREFPSGAVRSSNNGKPEFYGYRHPLVERSFGEYMLKHQTQEDGEQRKADNWWAGWDKEVSLQSLIRHLEDLTALQAGYEVYKVLHDNKEYREYTKLGKHFTIPDGAKCERITEEECCNAIRFNSGAYLLEVLKDNLNWKEYGQISKN